jgi:hypothetical protein
MALFRPFRSKICVAGAVSRSLRSKHPFGREVNTHKLGACTSCCARVMLDFSSSQGAPKGGKTYTETMSPDVISKTSCNVGRKRKSALWTVSVVKTYSLTMRKSCTGGENFTN